MTLKVRTSQIRAATAAVAIFLVVLVWVAVCLFLLFGFAAFPWNVIASLVVFCVPVAAAIGLWVEYEEHEEGQK